MGNINGEANKDSRTRTKEKRRYSNFDTRKYRDVGCQSRSFGYKSKRADRKDGSFSQVIDGDSTVGGMLRHLIKVHREQVAQMDAEIARMSSEKSKLEAKISDLEVLESEINKSLLQQK